MNGINEGSINRRGKLFTNIIFFIKWAAISLFALALVLVAGFTVSGKYTLDFNLEKKTVFWGPAKFHNGERVIKFGHPEIKNAVAKNLSKDSLFNSSRKVTYDIKAVSGNFVVYDLICESEIQSKSDEEKTFKKPVHNSLQHQNIEAEIDGLEIPPTGSFHPSNIMSSRFYEFKVPSGKTKKFKYMIKDIKAPLPHYHTQVCFLPTISLRHIVKGLKKIMNGLEVSSVPMTWKDNWEPELPTSENYKRYEWVSKRTIFPYNGAVTIIRKK